MINNRSKKVTGLALAIVLTAGLSTQVFAEATTEQTTLISALQDSGLYNTENAENYVKNLSQAEVSLLLETLENSNLKSALKTHAFTE
jgi:hypothetical protein